MHCIYFKSVFLHIFVNFIHGHLVHFISFRLTMNSSQQVELQEIEMNLSFCDQFKKRREISSEAQHFAFIIWQLRIDKTLQFSSSASSFLKISVQFYVNSFSVLC